ncbi:MAG: hypothetical protein ACWIPI_10195 [Polaribacter sp.]
MKKVFLVFGVFLMTIFSAKAQEISDNTLGLRLGSNRGFGIEISYQRKMNEINRLEINVGLRNSFSDFKAIGLYEWVWNLEDNFNWYAGGGGGVYAINDTSLFVSGVVGVEYNVDEIPLLISLDYRPELGITGFLNGLQSDFALSFRYKF